VDEKHYSSWDYWRSLGTFLPKESITDRDIFSPTRHPKPPGTFYILKAPKANKTHSSQRTTCSSQIPTHSTDTDAASDQHHASPAPLIRMEDPLIALVSLTLPTLYTLHTHICIISHSRLGHCHVGGALNSHLISNLAIRSGTASGVCVWVIAALYWVSLENLWIASY
jgi:hypothetical protein